jgi:hypothetical protein
MMTNNSRRSFLKKSGGVFSTALIPHAGFAIHAKSALVGERVGHGNFTYVVDKHWGLQDPGRFPVDHCHEMVQDKLGRLFLLTTHTRNNVICYDKSGRVLHTWGTEFPGAHGLTITEEGGEEYFFITDTVRHQVFKTTMKGKVVQTIDYPQETGVYENADQFVPTEVAVASNGDFYIADGYGKDYIIQYDHKGNYVRHFGGKGHLPEQFDCCHGITIDDRDAANPTLLITSRSTQEFKRFTLDGNYIESVKLPGCWICRPVIRFGYLYFAVIVTQSWWDYDGLVIVLDQDNKIVAAPGGTEPVYDGGLLQTIQYDGSTFMNPHDVCIDSDENIYVPQWYSGKSYPVKLERV